MPNDRQERTEQEPKLRFAKGCLWSILVSIPLWALLIWFLFIK
ncbi:hypothetical protein [Paenibacillus andongensis]|nr:hypothetical protein [Paenibacillus andongensis]